MQDKYDKAIKHLNRHPDEIEKAWLNFRSHPAGCLFQMMTPSGDNREEMYRPDGKECGCATMIKDYANGDASDFFAWTDELTEIIRKDSRIPGDVSRCKLGSLPAFAEIQRLADRTIRQPAESTP